MQFNCEIEIQFPIVRKSDIIEEELKRIDGKMRPKLMYLIKYALEIMLGSKGVYEFSLDDSFAFIRVR